MSMKKKSTTTMPRRQISGRIIIRNTGMEGSIVKRNDEKMQEI
jgi:hypothetical protein